MPRRRGLFDDRTKKKAYDEGYRERKSGKQSSLDQFFERASHLPIDFFLGGDSRSKQERAYDAGHENARFVRRRRSPSGNSGTRYGSHVSSAGSPVLGFLLIAAVAIALYFSGFFGEEKMRLQLESMRIANMQFYESDKNGLPENSRNYGTKFSRRHTRYIFCPVDISYQMPATAWDQTVDVKVVWYKPDGAVLVEQNTKQSGIQNANHLYINPRVGWDDSGKWEKGSYKVSVAVEGREIGSRSFSIN